MKKVFLLSAGLPDFVGEVRHNPIVAASSPRHPAFRFSHGLRIGNFFFPLSARGAPQFSPVRKLLINTVLTGQVTLGESGTICLGMRSEAARPFNWCSF